MKVLTSGVLIICLYFGVGCFKTAESNKEEIFKAGTKQFDEVTEAFRISSKDAQRIINDISKTGPSGSTLLFVAGEWYFFGTPLKASWQFTGYYFNGMTGVVEYRVSKVRLSKLPKYLNSVKFETCEVLKQKD